MISVTIREPATKEEWDQYYRIRYEVLRKPWDQPKQSTKDEFEAQSYHAIILNAENEIVAAGRLQFKSDTEGLIRSMAVLEGHRSKDYGSKMLAHLEEIAKSKKLSLLTLDAREPAVKFYERNGYRVTGPSYLLFGCIQHFKMEKLFVIRKA